MKTYQHLVGVFCFLLSLWTTLGQPTITTQPQNQTNLVGTDALFSVAAAGTQPLIYQWRFDAGLLTEVNLADQTNTTLVLTNVQPGNSGPYAVLVSNVDGVVTSTVATLTVRVPPKVSVGFRGQSANGSDYSHLYLSNSLSLGANVIFTAAASGTAPLNYQWQLNQLDLPGQTNLSFTLNNAQLTNAGDYNVVVTNVAGSVTSKVVTVTVDPTFTKITTGSIVTDVGFSPGGSWGDYDNDGFLDLFVPNGMDGVAYRDFLYHNNGDGTFTKITNGPPVSVTSESYSACWADYDNDGNLDLLVSTVGKNLLYHNNGNGTFVQVTNSSFVQDSASWANAAWQDYDKDGLLDVFAAAFAGAKHFLYHNNGDGTFTRITNNSIASDPSTVSASCAWADYDNDGRPDLFVCTSGGNIWGGSGSLQKNRLYHNDGSGVFTKVTTGSIVNDLGYSVGCAWGDYNNDGFLDLAVANNNGQSDFLYHNNGDGTFTRITNGIIATDIAGNSLACAWGDYDNDGFLDLYVGNEGGPDFTPTTVNFLYHNNGDGTFTKITTGSLVNEYSDSWGVTWADYDNDGFLDLFAARGDGRGNYLYHNTGNTNGWLTVKLVGVASNRSAIGATVRVLANIGGASRWQLRQISGGTTFGNSELRANFGAGNATNIDVVRIEWPSGIVQTLSNVAPKQILTVVEHQQPGITNAPQFTSVVPSTNGVIDLSVTGDAGFLYLFEASTNLVNWSWLGVRSNATGTVQFTDLRATNYASRFYRVSIP